MKSKWIYLALVLLVLAVYFALRLTNILALPIFTDEAIYVRWGQIARDDAAWRFISLTDGKQPSFIWAVSAMQSFISEPLLAARLVSVFAGLFTMLGLFMIGRELFKSVRIGVISALLYMVFPMALVYDRMALYDSFLAMFIVWGFYLTALLARTLRLDVALVLGMVIGAGVLTKTSAFFSIYLLPFSLLLVNFKKGKNLKIIGRWVILSVVVSVLAFIIYNILRLSPFFHIIEEKNALFVYPFGEWLAHPFRFLLGNLTGQFDWVVTYFTIPVFILVLLAPIVDFKFPRQKLILFLWFFVPFFALALFGRTLYPRFIFFMVLFLLPLAAYSLNFLFEKIKNKFLFALLVLLVFSFQIYADFMIITDFGRAPIADPDLGQYSNDWPSGRGVPESVTFFKEEAGKGPIFIATQGTFGLMPYAYEIYFAGNNNVSTKGFWPIDPELPQEVVEKASEMPVYFVFYQPCVNCRDEFFPPLGWNMQEVKRFKNPYGDSFLTIYRVNGD